MMFVQNAETNSRKNFQIDEDGNLLINLGDHDGYINLVKLSNTLGLIRIMQKTKPLGNSWVYEGSLVYYS